MEHGKTTQYIERIDETALQRGVKVLWLDDFEKYFGKPEAPTNLIQTMLHVPSHGAHHRGQFNTRLHDLGTQPPYIDFIVWLCRGVLLRNGYLAQAESRAPISGRVVPKALK
jgi:uncharacterized damage-inducible protein DinB